MDPFRKVTAGQPIVISARQHNAGVDAAQAHRSSLYGFQSGPTPQSIVEVKVQNDCGADRDIGEILGLDDLIISPDDNFAECYRQRTFSGTTPAHDQRQRFGVLLEPIANGRVGRCCIWGDCIARIEGDQTDGGAVVGGPTNYGFAGVKPDSYVLHTAPDGGAQILWQTASTSQRYAVVRVGCTPWLRRWQTIVSGWDEIKAIEIPAGYPGFGPGPQFDDWASHSFGTDLVLSGTGTFRTAIIDGSNLPGPAPKGGIILTDGEQAWAGAALGMQRVTLTGSGSYSGTIKWGLQQTSPFEWSVGIADPLGLVTGLDVGGQEAYIAPIQYAGASAQSWRWELIQTACPAAGE